MEDGNKASPFRNSLSATVSELMNIPRVKIPSKPKAFVEVAEDSFTGTEMVLQDSVLREKALKIARNKLQDLMAEYMIFREFAMILNDACKKLNKALSQIRKTNR
jgi:hypothetical protein